MSKPQLSKRNSTVSPRRVLGAIVALLVAFILFTSVIGLSRKYIAVRKRVNNLKEQQATLVEKQENIEKLNAYISTTEGAEQELRSKYNIVKPGEEIIVITKPEPITRPAPKTIVGKWWDGLLRGLGMRKD